jgi:hypothetical protein
VGTRLTVWLRLNPQGHFALLHLGEIGAADAADWLTLYHDLLTLILPALVQLWP